MRGKNCRGIWIQEKTCRGRQRLEDTQEAAREGKRWAGQPGQGKEPERGTYKREIV